MGNDGAGDRGKALAITYQGSNQTDSITNTNQEPVSPTWAGAGQSERVAEQWTHNGTNNETTYTYGLLGLAGVDGPSDSNPSPNPVVASWIVRDPSGRPVAQRYSTGQEYYYLFDGQGNVVALEDPGTIQAAYDYCPTGNNAALPGSQLTAAGLANPLRQGGVPYDDGTKDYFHNTGCIVEDASGVCTQEAGHAYADAPISAGPLQSGLIAFRTGSLPSGDCNAALADVGLLGAAASAAAAVLSYRAGIPVLPGAFIAGASRAIGFYNQEVGGCAVTYPEPAPVLLPPPNPSPNPTPIPVPTPAPLPAPAPLP